MNKKIIKLLLPALIEILSTSFLGIINGILVSHISEEAMSAVSIVDTMNSVVVTLFMSVTTGASVKVAQYLGSKRYEDASKAAEQSILLALIISAAVAGFVVIFGEYILDFLFGKTTESLRGMARIHMIISSISYIPYSIYVTGLSIFRGAGDFKQSLVLSLSINGLHVLLSAILIFALKLDVASIGISLIITRTIFAYVSNRMLRRGTEHIKVSRLFCKIDKEIASAVMKISIPACLDTFVNQGGRVAVQVFVAAGGTVALAANAIALNLSNFLMVPATAMLHICTSIIAEKFGANDMRETRQVMWKMTFLASLLELALCVPCYFLLDGLIGLYDPSMAVASQTRDLILLALIGYPTLYSLGFVTTACLRAVGDIKFTTAVSMGSMWFARVLCGWLLAIYFDMGVMGVWYTMILDWIVRGVFYGARILSHKWERLDRI